MQASRVIGSSSTKQGEARTDFRNRDVLQRLYWIEGRSIANIARLFGTSKGHIHYHICKLNVSRREWSGERPKSKPEELDRLYRHERLSIRQIAEVAKLAPSTVRKHVRRFGELRTQSQAQTKYLRTPFSGDESEAAYLQGLRAGDLNAWRTSPTSIGVRVSTTHPGMIELFQNTFGRYGHVTSLPRRVFLSGYDWQIRAYLDGSFDFLVKKPKNVPGDYFYHFLAGLTDSDGCWCIYNRRGRTALTFALWSEGRTLIHAVHAKLRNDGFHPGLDLVRRKGSSKLVTGVTDTRNVKLRRDLWALRLYRRDEVRSFAGRIILISRHREKVRKMHLILKEGNEEWGILGPDVEALRQGIRNETIESVRKAEVEYKARHPEASF